MPLKASLTTFKEESNALRDLSEAMNMTDDADVDENIEYCICEEIGEGEE